MYYMITYGMTKIEKAFIGITPEDVIAKARPLINQWPEYKQLETTELLELLLNDACEFDMVQIQDEWRGEHLTTKQVKELYEQKSLPPHLYSNHV